MKKSIQLLFVMTLSIQLLSQALTVRTDKSAGDIAITAIQHPCIGVVNGIDTTLGYFSALPLEQVWPLQLSASIANIGSNDQTNVVLSGEISNELGTIVYSSTFAGGNLFAGASMNLTLPDLFLPAATGNYTLRMWVTQDEGDIDLSNNEITRHIIDVNANGLISRIFEMNAAIEIPTGAGPVTSNSGIKFAVPNTAEIRSISVFIDTVIQAQTYLTAYLYDWAGADPVVQAIGEPFEINTTLSQSWVELPFFPLFPDDLLLLSHKQYLISIEAYNVDGIASIGADNADFHEFEVESHFIGYSPVPAKIPAATINLDYDIWVEMPTLGENVHVYPNPVTEILHIQNAGQVKMLVLNDLLGKPIRVIDYPAANQDIPLNGLPTGMYALKIVNQDNSGRELIIIKN